MGGGGEGAGEEDMGVSVEAEGTGEGWEMVSEEAEGTERTEEAGRGKGKGKEREQEREREREKDKDKEEVIKYEVGDPAPKRLPKPDRAGVQRELDRLKASEEGKLEELAELKRAMQIVDASRNGARAATGEVRLELQRLRAELGGKVREAQAVRGQLKALGEAKAAEQKKAVALRSGLGGLTSAEAIDQEIERLEGVISHESSTVAEEKRLIGQIRGLQASKKTVDEYAAAQERVREMDEERKGLQLQMDVIQADIDRVKKLLDAEEKGFHEAKGKEGVSESGMAPLLETRQRVRGELNEVRDRVREVRASLKAREDAYYLAERHWRTWNKVQKQAEWEGREAERRAEADHNQPVHFAKEIELCDVLTAYLQRLVPSLVEEGAEGTPAAEDPVIPTELDIGGLNLGKGKGGGVAVARVGKKGSAGGDDDDFFGVKKQGGKKGGKKGGGGEKRGGAAKAVRLTLDVETFVSFERVQLTAPGTSDVVGKSLEELAKKRAEFTDKQAAGLAKDAAEREAKTEASAKVAATPSAPQGMPNGGGEGLVAGASQGALGGVNEIPATTLQEAPSGGEDGA